MDYQEAVLVDVAGLGQGVLLALQLLADDDDLLEEEDATLPELLLVGALLLRALFHHTQRVLQQQFALRRDLPLQNVQSTFTKSSNHSSSIVSAVFARQNV